MSKELVEDLARRMPKADWWWSFSDDSKVRIRGHEEIDGLMKDLRILHAADPEAVKRLWLEHAPKEMARPDDLTTPDEQRIVREQQQYFKDRLTAINRGIEETKRRYASEDAQGDLQKRLAEYKKQKLLTSGARMKEKLRQFLLNRRQRPEQPRLRQTHHL